MEETKKEKIARRRLLNVCVFIFVVVVTISSLVTFFIAIFNNDSTTAYSIASIYILCMLLGAPTLKVFLDTAGTSNAMKRLNIIGVICIFVAILIVTVTVCISMVL